MLHLGSLLCCSIIASVSLFDLLFYRQICGVTLSSSILCLSSSQLCSSIVKSILCITSVSLFDLLLFRQICRVTLSSSILCLSSSQLCSSVVKSILCYYHICFFVRFVALRSNLSSYSIIKQIVFIIKSIAFFCCQVPFYATVKSVVFFHCQVIVFFFCTKWIILSFYHAT